MKRIETLFVSGYFLLYWVTEISNTAGFIFAFFHKSLHIPVCSEKFVQSLYMLINPASLK